MAFVVTVFRMILLYRTFVIGSFFVKNWLFACCALLQTIMLQGMLCVMKIAV